MKLLIQMPGLCCYKLMATDIHWQCRSPVKKIFDSLFRNSSLMQKIHSGLSTFGFIWERQTLVSLFLFTTGHQILFHHMFQPGGALVWCWTTHAPQSSIFVPTLQPWAGQLQSNPIDLELHKNTWPWLAQQASAHQRPTSASCVNHSCLGSSMNLKIIQKTRSSLTASFNLQVRECSWISMQPAQQSSSLHIQQTPPKLATWLEYLLANSCVLVENTQIIISAVCSKA